MRAKGKGYQTLRAVEGPRLCLIMRYLHLRGETVIIHRELLDRSGKKSMVETARQTVGCQARASNIFVAEIKQAESEGYRFDTEFPKGVTNCV